MSTHRFTVTKPLGVVLQLAGLAVVCYAFAAFADSRTGAGIVRGAVALGLIVLGRRTKK